jgi:ribosomal 50S subunit-associated protein YjgA (DUF615 family)
MDIGKLKKYSDLAHDINLTKRNSLEKMRARQIMAYNGRLFRADTETINTVSTLKAHAKEFYILDTNKNPCLIKDPEDFITKLIERNQETLITLSQLHDSLQRRR